MEEKRLTPIKAIHAKCLDCCCGNSNEVMLTTFIRRWLSLSRMF